jgi:hypothetical protein
MKNTQIIDVLSGVVSQVLSAKDGLIKMVTPEKTPYEKRKEYLALTSEDIKQMALKDPKKTIEMIVRHQGSK